MKYFIASARIINEGEDFMGDVLIRDGLIEKIIRHSSGLAKDRLTPEIPTGYTPIDATGKVLMPGVIDDQVHFREPGLTHKGNFFSESRAAVAGGITSFMDMPNTVPQTTSNTLLEEKNRLASETSWCNYAFFLGATNDNPAEIEKVDPSRVCGIKVFLGASTGNMLVDAPETLEKIFSGAQTLVAIHSEDESIIRNNLHQWKERFGEAIPPEAHPLIRSEEACYVSTARAIDLANRCGTRLHILHLSTARELTLLQPGNEVRQKKITAEACVHHLWFCDEDYKTLGNRIKWNPAIKTSADRDQLRKALHDGRIDIVATDHAPHTMEEKGRAYLHCPSGGPLVQHALPLMLELAGMGHLTLTTLVNKMCHAPAELYRIRRRGFIREGYHADLVLVDLQSPWRVTRENILYHCGWSPFEGQIFHAAVTHTFVNGQLVYDQGTFSEPGHGQPLLFES
ncbi:MAG: dihydroorotase [Bacteroidetes bacterium]|nr:dihydroorotase [Bacteroidota bacterium]